MVESFGVVCVVWIGSIVPLGVAVTGAFYLLAVDTTTSHHESENIDSIKSLRQFPGVFWQLALICILCYGGIKTFTISAQRFLAAWFYDGDQRKAGVATGTDWTDVYVGDSVCILWCGILGRARAMSPLHRRVLLVKDKYARDRLQSFR
ncbi:uncharacterized protein N7518_009842 [Penicillium psychrosexuale]|uniref:uncharacterized protein n=1 Tax=Penicillium psychrosexuale TaxID=1002107 RepID=UPI002544E1E9|nr:uncharacterized protein N7518_009842 [Penicillium psychrosexuale]KAJ5784165.1 hypothetical protein N7518_009842 [Penicillium psychrosexuale]